MAQSAVAPAPLTPSTVATPAKLPIRAVLPWAAFFGLLMLVLLYFVGAEQGATSLLSGAGVHEWVHDGRHLLGFPCH
ncbi:MULTISPECIES: CbtB-domain containing protein [unclassified Streptomyces]|uniref:CbtB domain-containing protein n=1 Tax=unclassified Streptomyces TaxID=2593676 RepID=UPI001F034D08|nr:MULTISPECIES: CbtB-domain containing protein [unclassified Streptomyces]MCH0567509.1 CbtB-domain containing protein [Streptomyces sp. MUM 2J]MCH0568256.1 CbtB-domain containing protein [Streptomyces sp. MUM 136J]